MLRIDLAKAAKPAARQRNNEHRAENERRQGSERVADLAAEHQDQHRDEQSYDHASAQRQAVTAT